MTQYTIYSPAPPQTRLHALNVEFGALLAEAGIENEVVPVALPDSINLGLAMPAAERAFHIPIVTNVDLIPAIHGTGPDWHAYDRACPDLKLVASLYDVAFGITPFGWPVGEPAMLEGRTIHAPPRPSAVRLLTETLLREGWDLGDVTLKDSRPPDLGSMIADGSPDATSWNITTVEGDQVKANLPIPHADFFPVYDATIERMNARSHFASGTCQVGDRRVIAFRQGVAVWDHTPAEFVDAVLTVLSEVKAGPFFSAPADLAAWPGLDDQSRHDRLLSLIG